MADKNSTEFKLDYRTATPYIVVKGVVNFLDFLQKAFDAKERTRVPLPDGSIGHAEVLIGDSILMMFDSKKDWMETPAFISLYVPDHDKTLQKAIDAGAICITEPSVSAWGVKGSRVKDPFGNIWWLQTKIEEVSNEESTKRMKDNTYQKAMNYAMQTFDNEMRKRNK